MDLFKGSKLNMSPFQPQTLHPDDFHKFPQPVPSSVIFASESETKAKIFATFSGIISFGTSSTSKKPGITVTLEDEIVPETKEWYNTQEQIPIEMKEYTREDLYKELKENKEITFEEKERFPIS